MINKKTTQTNNNQYSSYWFDEDDYYTRPVYRGYEHLITDTDLDNKALDKYNEERSENMMKLIKLGAFKRSCVNFVRILTGKDIEVGFEDGEASYTDGEKVVISGNIDNNFDSTVGLALHEASHIVLTNFKFFKKLIEDSKFRSKYISKEMIDIVIKLNPEIEKWDWDSMFSASLKPNFSQAMSSKNKAIQAADIFLLFQFKDILNWIEDRRIDNYVYSSAPGYRGYYESLYNRYFLSDEVTTMLKDNKMYNTETLDSYTTRLINLLNPENDVSVLKGLKEIKNIINVSKIDRLTSTEQAASVSTKVMEVIFNNITELDYMKQQLTKAGKSQIQIEIIMGKPGSGIDIDSLTNEECKEMFGMGKTKLKKLLKKLQEQKDFVMGKVKKKKLSKAELQSINTMASSGTTIEVTDGGEEFNNQKVNVLFIKKLNDATIKNENFAHALFSRAEHVEEVDRQPVTDGFTFGKMLGKRLQIRNEERTLKYTHLDKGKLDRRLVASLGYDVENVFSKIDVNKYNKAYIHISVDASGSMGGLRFEKAIKTSVAIAVAAKMVSNIECVISFRSTTQSLPVVWIGYDSRINNLAHIRKYFPLFNTTGTTPESLCFETLMKKTFPKVRNDEQFYFINLSDGEPTFSFSRARHEHRDRQSFYYSGERAYQHCKRMVNKMIAEYKATIISYLMVENDYKDCSALKQMYGRENASCVNTNNLEIIAKSLNKRFLEASSKSSGNE